jgi:hypothetical protein
MGSLGIALLFIRPQNKADCVARQGKRFASYSPSVAGHPFLKNKKRRRVTSGIRPALFI